MRSGLAVDRRRGAVHRAAEGRRDALVPEADAQHRQTFGEAPDGCDGDAGLRRRARTRRYDQVGGVRRLDLVERDGVVAGHGRGGAEPLEELHQVVGERVVVVDDEHVAHGSALPNCSWASSTARSNAAALFSVSSYSRAGSESATIPAPACT